MKLVDIDPLQHLSPSQCCAFLTKLHCDSMSMDATALFEQQKHQNGDLNGTMNYVPCLREIIIDQIKIVDKQISVNKEGSQDVSESNKKDSASTHAYTGSQGSQGNGNGNCKGNKGNKGNNPSTPDSGNTQGKIKKQSKACDVLGNPLFKDDGTPL